MGGLCLIAHVSSQKVRMFYQRRAIVKHLRLLVVCLGLLAVLMGARTTPARAYLWSDRANLEITVNPQGVFFVDAVNCRSATLSGNGRTYYPSVSNPFLSNKCVFKVSGAYVGNGVWYSLRFNYTYLFTSKTTSVNVYVKRPLTSTYSTSVNYTP